MIELLKQPHIQRWGMMEKGKKRFSYVSIGGQTKHVNEWLKETGISYSTFKNRHDGGWSLEKALTTPNQNFRYLEHRGIKLTRNQWAERLGITRSTLRFRLKNWSLDRALGFEK